MSIETQIQLTTDFDAAAAQLEAAMNDPSWVTPTIPIDYTFWNAPENIERFNCYNFAANLKMTIDNHGVFIGEAGLLKRNAPEEDYDDRDERCKAIDYGEFLDFGRFTIEQTEYDGALYCGLKPSFKPRENNFVLFLAENSVSAMEYMVNGTDPSYRMHYCAERLDKKGRSVWAGKLGENEVRDYVSPADMFQDAKALGYTHFAGYITRPHDLDVLENH